MHHILQEVTSPCPSDYNAICVRTVVAHGQHYIFPMLAQGHHNIKPSGDGNVVMD